MSSGRHSPSGDTFGRSSGSSHYDLYDDSRPQSIYERDDKPFRLSSGMSQYINETQSTIPSTHESCITSSQHSASSATSLFESSPSTPKRYSPSREIALVRPPRVGWFGVHLASLPPVGTAPSLENPRVNPLPVSLGIEINRFGRPNPYNPTVHLIHGRRVNEFDSSQPQLFLTLNDPRSTDIECPSYTANKRSKRSQIFFWADVFDPVVSEVLEELVEKKGMMKPTGNVSSTGAQEYECRMEVHKMSKKCERCGRWEALVDLPVKQRTEGQKWAYRRWNYCAGCEHCYFCRDECAQLFWSKHWRVCLQIRSMLKMD